MHQNVSMWRRFQLLPDCAQPGVDPELGDVGGFVAELVCGDSANAEKTARELSSASFVVRRSFTTEVENSLQRLPGISKR